MRASTDCPAVQIYLLEAAPSSGFSVWSALCSIFDLGRAGPTPAPTDSWTSARSSPAPHSSALAARRRLSRRLCSGLCPGAWRVKFRVLWRSAHLRCGSSLLCLGSANALFWLKFARRLRIFIGRSRCNRTQILTTLLKQTQLGLGVDQFFQQPLFWYQIGVFYAFSPDWTSFISSKVSARMSTSCVKVTQVYASNKLFVPAVCQGSTNTTASINRSWVHSAAEVATQLH